MCVLETSPLYILETGRKLSLLFVAGVDAQQQADAQEWSGGGLYIPAGHSSIQDHRDSEQTPHSRLAVLHRWRGPRPDWIYLKLKTPCTCVQNKTGLFFGTTCTPRRVLTAILHTLGISPSMTRPGNGQNLTCKVSSACVLQPKPGMARIPSSRNRESTERD